MAPLRWGIYSAGKISFDFVVGVKTLPETEHQVAAVASRSQEDAAKFAKTHSIPRHYDSYSQLAADAEVSPWILCGVDFNYSQWWVWWTCDPTYILDTRSAVVCLWQLGQS